MSTIKKTSSAALGSGGEKALIGFHLAFGVLSVATLMVPAVVPDWILSDLLNILQFPDDGVPKIGTVSGYMALLWTIPLFVIVAVGLRSEERGFGATGAHTAVALAALGLFGGSEATMWNFAWFCKNVTTVGNHLAVYILLPEVILGWATFTLFKVLRTAPLLSRLGGALVVMLLYTGSAVVSYFLLERVVLGRL